MSVHCTDLMSWYPRSLGQHFFQKEGWGKGYCWQKYMTTHRTNAEFYFLVSIIIPLFRSRPREEFFAQGSIVSSSSYSTPPKTKNTSLFSQLHLCFRFHHKKRKQRCNTKKEGDNKGRWQRLLKNDKKNSAPFLNTLSLLQLLPCLPFLGTFLPVGFFVSQTGRNCALLFDTFPAVESCRRKI